VSFLSQPAAGKSAPRDDKREEWRFDGESDSG
jgi:hypothetical protein